MSRVHGKDTKPEITVRKYLYSNGVRYRLHANLPGKPDISVRKKKLVVFVNGCFWHAHNCKRFSWPQAHSDFWKKKIEGNVARDNKNYELLEQAGWKVLVIWECELKKDKEKALKKLYSHFI